MYVSIRNEGKLRIWELFISHKTHTAQNSFLLTHIRKGPATFLLRLCVVSFHWELQLISSSIRPPTQISHNSM